MHRPARRLLAAGATSAFAALSWAQPAPRPDAGIVLEPQRALPALPAPGGPPIVVAPPAPPAPAGAELRITPAAFRIEGNTLVSTADLQAAVAPFVGRTTNLPGLNEAAAAVRKAYRDRGYILSDALLPPQQFTAEGGTVTIQVLEARVGRATVRTEAGVSESLARGIVERALRPGSPITEAALEQPVLLLRDLSGWDAGASVEPGTATGEADIVITARPAATRTETLVGTDNSGVRSAGQWHLWGAASLDNPTGRGDQLSARAQLANQSGSRLFRLAYATTLNAASTRAAASITRSDYALGGRFAALGANGVATVTGLTLTQPLRRTRENSVYASAALEHKDLSDHTDTPASDTTRRIDSLRIGLAGSTADGFGGASFNSYALGATFGHLSLDATSLAQDQGPSGLRTAGGFRKINLEASRTTYLSAATRIAATLQAQWANRNLASAEKLGLGGPGAVRGYPVGEAVGDSGAVINLELRQQLPTWHERLPLAVGAFADWGRVRYNAGPVPAGSSGPASESLRAVGLGLYAGRPGDLQLSAQLAWRTARPSAADADRRPRFWFTAQKWL